MVLMLLLLVETGAYTALQGLKVIIPWHSTSLFALFSIDVPSHILYFLNAIFEAVAETLPVTAEKANRSRDLLTPVLDLFAV